MPKSRTRKKRRRRGGNGDAGGAADEVVFPPVPTHTPVFTGSHRAAVASLAAGAAHDRAQRLAGRNLRRREWMQGPRGHGRRLIAQRAAAAARARQRPRRAAATSAARANMRAGELGRRSAAQLQWSLPVARPVPEGGRRRRRRRRRTRRVLRKTGAAGGTRRRRRR